MVPHEVVKKRSATIALQQSVPRRCARSAGTLRSRSRRTKPRATHVTYNPITSCTAILLSADSRVSVRLLPCCHLRRRRRGAVASEKKRTTSPPCASDLVARTQTRTWMMMIDGVPKNEKRTKGAAEEGVLVFLCASVSHRVVVRAGSRILWPAIPGRSTTVVQRSEVPYFSL